MDSKIDYFKQHEIIAENVSNGILLETVDGKVQFTNNLFLELFKIDVGPKALIGNECNQVIHYISFLFINPYSFLITTEKHLKAGVRIFNEELLMNDGRVILRDYIPFYDHGILSGHLWMYKEITNIKRLEKESEKLKYFYERILDNIPVDIAVFDAEQRFLYVNKLAVNDENTRKWVIGKTKQQYYERFVESKNIEGLRKNAFFRALITGKNAEYTESSVGPDGLIRYDLRSFFSLVDDNNEMDVVIRYGINITALVAKDRELEEINQKLNNLINSMDEAMIIVDGALKIEFVNPSWTKIFGYDRQSSISNDLGCFFSQSNLDIIKKSVEAISDYNTSQIKKRFSTVNKFGTHKVVDCFITSFLDRQERKFSCLFTDVTAEERGLSELKMIVEKERNLNQLKSDFVNMVSHELRTPLAIIQSSAEICEMMVMRSTSSFSAQLQEYLSNITGEVDRITKLLTEVLLVSKIESGKINAVIERIDLEQFLLEIIEKSYSPWRDGRLIGVVVVPLAGKMVSGDVMMLRHIFENLIENAFKYSPNRTSPKCRVKIASTWWSFTIADAGIGISALDLDKLSKPFFRGNNVAEIGGTGLGLAVVYYFVSQLNATLHIRSTVNKGSIFYLKFKNEKDSGY